MHHFTRNNSIINAIHQLWKYADLLYLIIFTFKFIFTQTCKVWKDMSVSKLFWGDLLFKIDTLFNKTNKLNNFHTHLNT